MAKSKPDQSRFRTRTAWRPAHGRRIIPQAARTSKYAKVRIGLSLAAPTERETVGALRAHSLASPSRRPPPATTGTGPARIRRCGSCAILTSLMLASGVSVGSYLHDRRQLTRWLGQPCPLPTLHFACRLKNKPPRALSTCPHNVSGRSETATRHTRRQRVSGAQSLRLFAKLSVSAPLQARRTARARGLPRFSDSVLGDAVIARSRSVPRPRSSQR
jgi:hypothetical protein